MKKKLLIITLIVLSLATVSACGIRSKIEKKAGEAIGEKILEQVGGGDISVNIDDDQLVIEGSDGEKMHFGGGEWPDDSKLIKAIPEYDSGKITSVFKTEGSVSVTIDETDDKYFESYLKKIKSAYTEDAFESMSEGSVTFSGGNEKGVFVTIFYSEGNCIISVTQY